MNYYNEIDPFAAKWLRNLISNGLIPKGEVDERSIADVRPSDLAGYIQCHFFAGIGGWSYALKLAQWPENIPVWTGSCPCQPFSAAATTNANKGFADKRHLWPTFYELIRKCRPSVIFGEQVASKDGLLWFDSVYDDLEDASYAIGASDLCAASVGAPHIRQRLYFVGESASIRQSWRGQCDGSKTPSGGQETTFGRINRKQIEERCIIGSPLVNTESEQVGLPRCTWFDGRPSDWIECLDGRQRPVEPGTFPLAHGVPARVGRLRGYGNAIVPQVAQAFIEAYMES